MARMGHDSSQAALIYQHATAEADRAIAEALGKAVRAKPKRATKKDRQGEKGRRGERPTDGTGREG